jgi:uncharacterized protein YdeI (YjbR/CyaY-like superfamily)
MAMRFFKTPSDFRKWLEAHHATTPELWVGFYKRNSGKPSLTWPESVDEALCFGWIDGIRKSVDEESYTIRFSPRRPTGTWSAVNIRRAEELEREGRMRSAGRQAFEARKENRSGIYSYEQRSPELPEPYQTRLRSNQAAWDFYSAQSPSYRKTVNWWVLSAKKEQTRLSRLQTLIEDSARGRDVPPLRALKSTVDRGKKRS